jgi:hypothetical protein
VAKANNNENLNTDLATIFSAIESSANGYPSEAGRRVVAYWSWCYSCFKTFDSY